MKKIEYLLLTLKHRLYANKSWIISAFTIIKEDAEAYKKNPYYLRLVPTEWGYSFLNDQAELVKIDDAVPKEPLFRFKDTLTVTSDWAPNITGNIDTTIGKLLFNYICILSSFGPKFPYLNSKITVKNIEATVAPLLQNTPLSEDKRDSKTYYVDEYLKFVDALQFTSSLSQIVTICVTRKSMLAPTGIKEFKATLIKKYEGKLEDPVYIAKYEQELKDFDEAYLKGDPSNGTFITGKVKDTARKKMFLTMGAESGGFSNTDKPVVVLNSLEEGWPTDDPKQFTAMMNGLRYASYSRGAETVKGGVSAKYLLRAGNSFKIVDIDCNSKLGIHRTFTGSNIGQLIGRYILQGSKLVRIENNTIAANYLNQQLIVRSPMYCKLEGDNICKICAGDNLSKFPNGLTIPLTEISGIILTTSLKFMHSSSIKTKKMDITKTLS